MTNISLRCNIGAVNSFEAIKIATIFKTESGTWKAQIRRKGWPTVVKSFRIKRDAEDWARTTEDEIIRGIYVPRSKSEKLGLADALDRYILEVTPTKKLSTQKAETYRVKQLKSALGQYTLASLNSDILGKYRDERLKEGKSSSTVRLELALLGHLYTTAIQEWQLGVSLNPVQNVRKPSSGEGRSRRLIGDEEQRLVAACNSHSNPFLGWVVRIALFTAMRQGEILTLTKQQVNLESKTVLLSDTKNNEIRTVPLTKKALEVFGEVLSHPVRPINTNLLFYGEPGKDGNRRPYTINRVWANALKRAEISSLRFHDLRHEATSRFVEAGLSDQEVASITGHKSMQMLKRYTHLRTENLTDKIANI